MDSKSLKTADTLDENFREQEGNSAFQLNQNKRNQSYKLKSNYKTTNDSKLHNSP